MLLSMLRSHPQIHARGEFLGRLDDADLDERLETAFRAPPQIRAVGFKAFYYIIRWAVILKRSGGD